MVLRYVSRECPYPDTTARSYSSGSSRGRGTRAAGWFADIIADNGDNSIESLFLQDGVAGWASGGEEFTVSMHEYDASKWKNTR